MDNNITFFKDLDKGEKFMFKASLYVKVEEDKGLTLLGLRCFNPMERVNEDINV